MLLVTLITMTAQFFILTVMAKDMSYSNYYFTDDLQYMFLRYSLLIFSFILFLREIGDGGMELRLSG